MSTAWLALGSVLLASQPQGTGLEQLQAARRAVIDADLHGDWTALIAAREQLTKLSGVPGLRGLVEYELGYADWRLSSLAYLGAGKDAQMELMLRAAAELQASVAARPDFADAQALLAWVAGSALGTDAERGAPLGRLIQPAWKAAAPAVASNPRVALLRAMSTTFAPPAHGGNRERGLEQWKAAAALFEKGARGDPELPIWGRAESLGWLGGALLAGGDPAGAVRWFERALAVRPDFWWVRTLGLPQARRAVVASVRTAGAQPAGRTGMDEAMRGIEALRRRDEAASKAYDVKALAELWTKDAVALPPGGPVKRGPELQADLAKMAEAARGTEVLDYREVFEETLVFGDTAVEWGHIEGSERDRSTGKVTTSRFHLMRILKRVEDGSWRVHRSIFAPAG